MSNGNLKPGPAAGDSDIRNNPIIEAFVNRESELGTLSEPRPTALQVSTLITPVQHRQSMPYEGVSARLADYPQSARIFSGVHVTPVHLMGHTSVNIRDNPSIQSSQSQQNNNMLFQKSSLDVELSEKQNRRGGPKTNIVQHSCVDDDETSDCLRDQVSSLYKSSNSARNYEGMLCKTITYGKAHIFCLSASIVTFVLILFESRFLLACLYTENDCATVASFVFRAALLSIIIILLELIKLLLQRVKSTKLTSPYPANTASADLSVPGDGLEVRFGKSTAQPVISVFSSVDRVVAALVTIGAVLACFMALMDWIACWVSYNSSVARKDYTDLQNLTAKNEPIHTDAKALSLLRLESGNSTTDEQSGQTSRRQRSDVRAIHDLNNADNLASLIRVNPGGRSPLDCAPNAVEKYPRIHTMRQFHACQQA
ncbi:hypothetical protein EGR_01351 [Echinococcus granulosus]|uniref:Uncharacterized protein n=1 Tax=Echinococcus granulosus TaxID=6210 RepID=W6UR71_ECHGR|nr:hypothetical protein EGR_01351 [Echinococcus granulosus]EUB63728.1 hypothetical protein EGR_01351 [Echinococcus granulosus]